MERFEFPEHGITYERKGDQDIYFVAKIPQAAIDEEGKLHYHFEWHITNATSEEEATRNLLFAPGEVIAIKSLSQLMQEFHQGLEAAKLWVIDNFQGE